MDANDFVIELASANIPRLSYFDFKDKIQKRYKNLDNDDIGDLFTLYNKERNNNERRATDFLKKLIDENKAADGKSEAQLFQLASFRDRQYLVNKNEIHKYYVEHYKPHYTEQELEQQRLIEAQIKYEKAKEETERRARTNVNKVKSINKFRTKAMDGLSDEAVDELFKLYSSLWDELHPQPKPKKPKQKSFKEKVDEYVITHPDEILTYEEFNNVSRGWNRTMTQQEAYKYYKDKFFQLPGVTVKIDEPKQINKLGFKDERKYIFGTRGYELKPKINFMMTNSFPLKSNLKKYGLHKVAPRGTYIVDFMFDDKLVYLVAINVNTRYGMIELTNITNDDGDVLKEEDNTSDVTEVLRSEGAQTQSVVRTNAKNTISYLRALEKMIREVSLTNPIKHLNGDGEGAFSSNLAKAFYQERGITFHPAPRMLIVDKKKKKGYKTEPLHGSLALVDRFIRTLRDMTFNAGYKLTPLVLKEMVRQYNNAPHSTLSKIIGFDVSPLMVQKDKNKEEYIVMKINKENIATMLNGDYELNKGMNVKVYNEKNVLGKRRTLARKGEIIGKQGSLYKVKTNLGEELIPRYKIAFND